MMRAALRRLQTRRMHALSMQSVPNHHICLLIDCAKHSTFLLCYSQARVRGAKHILFRLGIFLQQRSGKRTCRRLLASCAPRRRHDAAKCMKISCRVSMNASRLAASM